MGFIRARAQKFASLGLVLILAFVMLVNFSTPTVHGNGSGVADQLSPLGDNLVRVWGYSVSDQHFQLFDPKDSRVTSDLLSLNKGQGYWVNVRKDQQVQLSGRTYFLREGWNLIGWGETGSVVLPVKEFAASLGGNLVRVWGFDVPSYRYQLFDPADARVSDLTTLNPGQGYWINVTKDITLKVRAHPYNLVAGWNLIGW